MGILKRIESLLRTIVEQNVELINWNIRCSNILGNIEKKIDVEYAVHKIQKKDLVARKDSMILEEIKRVIK